TLRLLRRVGAAAGRSAGPGPVARGDPGGRGPRLRRQRPGDPGRTGRMTVRRGLIWGLLVAALVLVAAAAAFQRWRRPEPPPVLGRVPAFELTNRDGRQVTLADLAGRPWVADFIFTRCPASCPVM